MTLQELLDARQLPAVAFPSSATGWWQKHRELSRLLCQEAYGQLPPQPVAELHAPQRRARCGPVEFFRVL